MRGNWKTGLLSIAVLLLAAVIAVPFLVDVDRYRPRLESSLSEALDREVRIGKLTLSFWRGGLYANQIEIAEDPDFGETPFLMANGLSVGARLLPLITERRLIVEEVLIDAPTVRLIQNDRMRWNFDSLANRTPQVKAEPPPADAPEAPSFVVALIRLRGGHLVVQPAGSRPEGISVTGLQLDLRDVSPSSIIGFSLNATLAPRASLRADGTLGPLPAGDLTLTPMQAEFSVDRLHIVETGLVQPAAHLSAVLSGKGSLQADNGTSTLRMAAEVNDLAVGETATPSVTPVLLETTIRHNLVRSQGTIESATVQAGDARATIRGSYRLSPSQTIVDLELDAPQMPVDDLARLLPSFGVALPAGASLVGGTLHVQSRMAGPTTALSTNGSISLADSVLTGYSFSRVIESAARLAGLAVSADTAIQLLRADLVRSQGQTQLNGIDLNVPNLGQLQGDLRIGERDELDGALLATIQTTGGLVGVGLEHLTGGQQTVLRIPLLIGGTASQPAVSADTRDLVKGAARQAVETYAPKAREVLEGLFGRRQSSEEPKDPNATPPEDR